MEKESTGERGMGVGYTGSQSQTKRTVELQEEEEEEFITIRSSFPRHSNSVFCEATIYSTVAPGLIKPVTPTFVPRYWFVLEVISLK
jgi:hypothetical protein